MKKVNLGCGAVKKEGYINVDWKSQVSPEIVHDLNQIPYPFGDNEIDLVEASHILEHLDRPFDVMVDIHRILKPGGRLIIKVPHFSRGFTHSEHTHGFDVIFPHFFDKNFTRSGYVGVEFALEKMELHWFPFFHHLPYLGYGKVAVFLLRIVNSVLSSLANLNQHFCSRIWCFWVGGFDEIEFHFICKK